MNSNMQDKLYAIYGIRRFLEKFDISGNIESDYFINKIFVEFLKENNIDGICPNNKKGYKGQFRPCNNNAILIQENFKLFKKWIKDKYK